MKLIPSLIHRLFGAAADVSRRLVVQREGNVLVLFAMASIPVIIAAGIAIDSARAYMIKQRLGSALDAAALAVGSQSTTASSSTLTTDLNNYFYDNYCKKVPTGASVTSCTSTVATEYNISVQANTSITAATVTYTANATVPTTFMRLVGVNSLPVSATTQTTKFPGMEIAVVLDNTGSMLCGQNEGAPSVCGASPVDTSDTSCSDTSNGSRICTLRRASLDFMNTLQAAITGPQSVYMSIVPFVTTVNIGNNSTYGGSNTGLCTTTGTTCSNLTTDATSGDYTDWRGDIMPVIPLTGTTTNASTSVSSVSFYGNGAYNSGTAALQSGMNIYGHGIPSGTTISSTSGTSLTLSSSANLSFTGNTLAAGPSSTSANISTPYIDPTTANTTGSWTNGSKTLTVTSATGIVVGMVVTSTAATGIPTSPSTTVSAITGTTITLSANATVTQTNKAVIFSMGANTTSGSATVSGLKGSTSTLNSIVVGMPVCGPGIPGSVSPCTTASTTNIPTTYVTSVTGSPPTSFTMSAAASSTNTNEIVTFWNLGATTNTGSRTVYNASFSTVPSVGDIIVGNGIPANTTITAVSGTSANFTADSGQLTISQNATTPSNFSSATAPCPPTTQGGPGGSNCYNTGLVDVTPISYDSAYNTTTPLSASTTAKWGGCVVEPTSSGENASGTGVLASGTNPDTTEPASGTKWYPFYWVNDSTNTWTPSTVQAQNYNTESQGGEQTDWQAQDGPNQGCPVPMLPLTDMTTSAGQTILQNVVNSMWPRDSGGTQVHIGAIWGWRTLSPNGPFAANNGHPLTYAQATSTGWKKIMVLMTDGLEEWPTADNLTGLGQINDGKIGTTSTTTAVTNLGTRLSSVCTNMASDSIMIFTIGLASAGSSNTQLQTCPANGGFYCSAASTSSLDSCFQQIAAAIIHLRLTQ